MNKFFFLFAVAFLLTFCTRLDAQLIRSTMAESFAEKTSANESLEHIPFQVRTNIGIGFNGFNSSTQYLMVDENGFNYDTLSLLRKRGVKKQLEMDEEQFEQLVMISEERKARLSGMLAGEIVDALTDKDDLKQEMAEQFCAGEDRMRELLTEEQNQRLDQMHIRLAVEEFGAASALGTGELRDRIGLTDSDLNTIKELGSGLDEKVDSHRKQELKIANQSLLDKAVELSAKELSQEELVDKPHKDNFLQSQLFPNDNPHKKSRSGTTDVTRLLKLKTVRKDLEVTDEQFEDISKLRVELRENNESHKQTMERVGEILDTKQMQKLNQVVAAREYSRTGTVSTLSHGFLAERLGLNKEQRTEIFEFGKELQLTLNQGVVDYKSQLVRESLSAVPADRRQAVLEVLTPSRR